MPIFWLLNPEQRKDRQNFRLRETESLIIAAESLKLLEHWKNLFVQLIVVAIAADTDTVVAFAFGAST